MSPIPFLFLGIRTSHLLIFEVIDSSSKRLSQIAALRAEGGAMRPRILHLRCWTLSSFTARSAFLFFWPFRSAQ